MCQINSKNSNNKGSFTIEAVIVMSSILMILFAMLFAFTLMYQNVVVMYAASYAASQGALVWNNSESNIDTGTAKTSNDDLYFRISEAFDGNSALIQKKKQKILKAAQDKLALSIIPVKASNINVEFDENIIQRRITVEISQKMPIPILDLAKYFSNDKDGITIKAKSSSAIQEPTEYIRNIDLAIEIVQRIKDGVDLSKIWTHK